MLKKFDEMRLQLEDIDPNAGEYDDEDSSIDESELNDDFDVDGDLKREKSSDGKEGERKPKKSNRSVDRYA